MSWPSYCVPAPLERVPDEPDPVCFDGWHLTAVRTDWPLRANEEGAGLASRDIKGCTKGVTKVAGRLFSYGDIRHGHTPAWGCSVNRGGRGVAVVHCGRTPHAGVSRAMQQLPYRRASGLFHIEVVQIAGTLSIGALSSLRRVTVTTRRRAGRNFGGGEERGQAS